MNERRRSCKGEDGEFLYDEWYCGVCGEKYDNQSLAKYCCSE